MYKLLLKTKSVYGKDMLYPVDDYTALVLSLTGKRTFDVYILDTFRKIGFSITIDGIPTL